jgi:hypothetical protein
VSDGRRARLLGAPCPLHDVRDPEAHVRVLLDARLGQSGARLDADYYEDALTFLLEICWELSGLDDGGRPRVVWYVDVYIDGEEIDAGDEAQQLGPFPREARAIAVQLGWVDRGFIAGVREGRPPGAYDPDLGLSFSTYSRRVLSLRVADWYRRTFGDSRYGGRRRELSLNAMATARGEPVEEFLDTLSDGADETEEVLTRVAFGS